MFIFSIKPVRGAIKSKGLVLFMILGTAEKKKMFWEQLSLMYNNHFEHKLLPS